MNEQYYELHANLCSIFASAKKLQILDILRNGELTVSQILEKMSISKTNLSQNLTIMKERGILKTRREGQYIYYSIANGKVLQAYDIMSEVLRELMDSKMAQLH